MLNSAWCSHRQNSGSFANSIGCAYPRLVKTTAAGFLDEFPTRAIMAARSSGLPLGRTSAEGEEITLSSECFGHKKLFKSLNINEKLEPVYL
jgi:hypothetical protein